LRGFGTQRVEQELTALFPESKIIRMDLDTTTRKGAHEKLLREFGDGKADILLGTQMVAKGLDFPRVTLVGVISADTQMMLPDFRSAERTFQLLTQVAGRAGRSALAGEVIIQTSQPAHYSLRHVQDHDFNGFYKEELEFRRATFYPPFSRISLLEFRSKNEKKVEEISATFGKLLRGYMPPQWILGPATATLEKIKNEYRWQIIIKADKTKDKNGSFTRNAIQKTLHQISEHTTKNKVKIIVDVDPAGIL
jgi:primosomal protein N' (replication factor Y)